MLIPYSYEVTFSPATPAKAVALVHPGSPQTGSLLFRGFDVIGQSEALVRFRLSRHPSEATGGTSNTTQSFLDGAPASYAQVLSGSPTWPVDVASFSIVTHTMTRASAGGLVVPTNNASNGALTIGPDHSLIIESLDADARGDYTIRLFWGEQWSALPHVASSVLPASGTYTAGTYFSVPEGWEKVTFFIAYTAHASTVSGGRPLWRASASDGTNDFPMLVIDEEIDVSTLPAGLRTIFRREETWPEVVAAGTTIRFTASFLVPPGAPKVRLDIKEDGDTTNRGTVVVSVTGA
jgi:hypothetical protein